MSKTTKTKKAVAAGLAAVIAASTAMAGTLAWQSLNQEATNLLTGSVNPGGRLHDDYNREPEAGVYEKNVYVENFGTQKIYARVQLSEFLAKADGLTREKVEKYQFEESDIVSGIGNKGVNESEYPNMLQDHSIYTLYDPNSGSKADLYWEKSWGGSANYIPTFNMNQDSLAADLNGEPDYDFVIINEGDPNVKMMVVDEASELYPPDNVTEGTQTYFQILDENGSRTYNRQFDADDDADDNNGPVTWETAEHNVGTTDTSEVISMDQWINEKDSEPGPYWVYDEKGWFYWAQAIAPGYEYDIDGNLVPIEYTEDSGLMSTTGLLLDSLTDTDAIDEDYVYAIHVDSTFVTANDIGSPEEMDGFYQDGEELSEDVQTLLVKIGAVSDGRWEDDGDDEEDNTSLSSVIDLWPDTDTTVKGGEFLLFEAAVYDEYGDVIAYTNDVEFSVTEITSSDVSAAALFDQTCMDDNALFVAEDVIARGVETIVVSASYTDEDEVKYTGEYELEVQPAESPLKISMELDGTPIVYNYPENRLYQMFMANPSGHTYQFSAKYNDTPSNVTWRLKEEGQYTVVNEDSKSVALATGEWDEEWEMVNKGTEVATIDADGTFKILIKDAFPRTMQFTIQAEYTDTDTGETFTTDSILFIGRSVATFNILNADVDDPNDIKAHSATYTKNKESIINLSFFLEVNEEEKNVDYDKIRDWRLYAYDEINYDEIEIDSDKYTVTQKDNGDFILTIPKNSGIDDDMLWLKAKYYHGVRGPREPDGLSEGVLTITESAVAADMDKISDLAIYDESTNWEYATYTPGTYAKIKLEADTTTASGNSVGNGYIIWSLDDNSKKDPTIQLVQNNYTAEVWILKSDTPKITVTAMCSSKEEGGVLANATFDITAQSDEEVSPQD